MEEQALDECPTGKLSSRPAELLAHFGAVNLPNDNNGRNTQH
jgi:hypothetical protein